MSPGNHGQRIVNRDGTNVVGKAANHHEAAFAFVWSCCPLCSHLCFRQQNSFLYEDQPSFQLDSPAWQSRSCLPSVSSMFCAGMGLQLHETKNQSCPMGCSSLFVKSASAASSSVRLGLVGSCM
mmetsp:Transcript_41256/g.81416  ORF Transcript_41256/g.81416 Transcript_41256/m.81416 type:complete len:124 (-) Transcript_41256:21-392(-)